MGLEVEDLKEAFGSLAASGAATASSFAPRDSGALAGSFRGNKAKNKAVVSAGGGRVVYAGVQNYGWSRRNIPATSFMQKADAKLQPEAIDRIEAAINAAIARRGLQ